MAILLLIIFIHTFFTIHILYLTTKAAPHLPTNIKAKSSYLPEEINNLTNYAAGLIVAHDKRKFDCIMTQKSFLKSAR